MTTQSVDCLASILACLPDPSQNASRLLFTSMVTIATECPSDTVDYLLGQYDQFHHDKHDTIYELLSELIRNDADCVTNGQANQLITLATEERSFNRLKLVGALCQKYQAEIVDHLLGTVTPHTLCYMSKIAEEINLSSSLLTRLVAGSQPYFGASLTAPERVECCNFITSIMRNYCDARHEDKTPFLDGVFDSLYASLILWTEQKATSGQSDELRIKSLEAAAWLCHGLPWSRCDELEKLLKLYQERVDHFDRRRKTTILADNVFKVLMKLVLLQKWNSTVFTKITILKIRRIYSNIPN